ncbi:MAG: hypothetical protein ACO28Q_10635 [Ilumatobacteraceae bacterium]
MLQFDPGRASFSADSTSANTLRRQTPRRYHEVDIEKGGEPMKNTNSEASAVRPTRRSRPFDPEFEALLAEGYRETADEALAIDEEFAFVCWEALQLTDPD